MDNAENNFLSQISRRLSINRFAVGTRKKHLREVISILKVNDYEKQVARFSKTSKGLTAGETSKLWNLVPYELSESYLLFIIAELENLAKTRTHRH